MMVIRDYAFERALPNSSEAERAILGAILLDNGLISQAIEWLKPEDFYVPSHRRIFVAMIALFERGAEINPILIGEELKKENALEAVGGVSFITNLTYGLPHSTNIAHYAKVVRGKSMLRQLIKTSNQNTQEALAEEDEPEVIMDHAETRVFELRKDRIKGQFRHIKEAAEKVLDRIQEQEGHVGALLGLTTGYPDLDKMTSGFQKQDLIILAARPSMGKTSLALMFALNAALANPENVIPIFSLEMSTEALVMRLLCAHGNIDSSRFRNGFLSRLEWAQIARSLGVLSDTKIFIDDTPGISVLDMRAKTMRLFAEQKRIDLIIADYLQKMSAVQRRKSDSRQQEVSDISGGLKDLAKELDVPLVALSQLSRALETRTNKRPQLADLRESGCLAGETKVTLATGARATINEMALLSLKPDVIAPLDGRPKTFPCARVFSTGIKPVFLLETTMGRRIKATANHRFWCGRGWKRLDELQPEDSLPVMVPDDVTAGEKLSTNELILLAHLIGNGCLLPTHSAQYTTRHKDLADLVMDTSKSFFGSDIDPVVKYDNPRSQEGWFNVFFRSTRHHTHGVHSAVTDWAKQYGLFGVRSRDRCVPWQVFQQTNRRVSVFLSHLWSTDGTLGLSVGKKTRPTMAYSSASDQLIDDVQFLLLRLSILSSVDELKRGRHKWRFLSIVGGGVQFDRFLQKIKPVGKYQGEETVKIADHLNGRLKGQTKYRLIGGWVKDRVRQITPAGTEECFDLTIPQAHCFQANGLIAHNSLEQDADVVAFIFREEQYLTPSERDALPEERKNVAEIIIGKQRSGPTGTVDLRFTPSSMRFDNLYRETTPALDYGDRE